MTTGSEATAQTAATAIEATQPAVDLSLLTLIGQSDIVVKGVMILLFMASIWCWTIIFDKFTYFRRMKDRMTSFERNYRSTKSLEQIYSKAKKTPDNAMAAMFAAGMAEIYEGVLEGAKNPGEELKEHAASRVYYSIIRVKNKALERMEKSLIFLATVGSAAPFVGLFGTVWGIVNSFQSIASAKNTSLAVVAPGIAEALLATAIGLFAAIPAVVFYNMFSNEIRLISARLDEFADELGGMLKHQIYNSDGNNS